MNLRYPTRLALAFALAVSLPPLLAGSKIDLERATPVPADQPIPIQDFFRPKIFVNPRINPSGTRIAALVTLGHDQYSLLVYELERKTLETLSGVGDKDISYFEWLTDQRLVFGLSSLKYYHLGLFAAEAGNLKHAYPLQQYAGTQLLAIPKDNPEYPLVWMSFDALETGKDLGLATLDSNVKSGHYSNLYAANVENDDFFAVRDSNDRCIHKVVAGLKPTDRDFVIGYLADKEGRLAFGFSSSQGVSRMHYLDGSKWKTSPVNLEEVQIVGVGNRPGEVVGLHATEPGKPFALQILDARTGEAGQVLLQDKNYDFEGQLYRDPVTREILGAFFDRGYPQTVWFTEKYRSLQKNLDGFFPGLYVRVLGSDQNQVIFLVATSSDRQPPIYYTVDLARKSVAPVKNSSPWIDPKRMRSTAVMKYQTRDGKTLDAYVTLPEGVTKANPPPLVVLPHGGPWVRDTWGFDGEVQFLASRGYAVLQPNYRGSPGYNWMFPDEDTWDFRKMHEDVTDATHYIVNAGLVDAKRIAIMGGSFGGYLAVSGVVNEPDLYRCAVTNAGVFDWGEMIRDEKYYRFDSPWYDRMIRKLGDPREAKEKFDRISPIRLVGNIKVPVFVAHGKDDTVVSVNQSKMLIAELKSHQLPYEAMLVGGESHGMAHLENQVELYSRIESFLARHLKGAP